MGYTMTLMAPFSLLETLTPSPTKSLPAVLKHFPLPPVKKTFIPDPGYILVDADLDGAEARWLAWRMGGSFKEAFQKGLKIHVDTMEHFFHDKWEIDPKYEPLYTKCKNMAYGTIYVGGAPGIAATASIPVGIVRSFQPWFFNKYPGIRTWHHETEVELYSKRTATNPFGFRIYFFDRPEGLLPQACAWQPQSSIGVVTQRGQRLLRREFPQAELLLQVHDSIIFQVQWRHQDLLDKIKHRLSTAEELAVPFKDPCQIPFSFKASKRSWGDAKELDTKTLQIVSGLDASKQKIWEAL